MSRFCFALTLIDWLKAFRLAHVNLSLLFYYYKKNLVLPIEVRLNCSPYFISKHKNKIGSNDKLSKSYKKMCVTQWRAMRDLSQWHDLSHWCTCDIKKSFVIIVLRVYRWKKGCRMGHEVEYLKVIIISTFFFILFLYISASNKWYVGVNNIKISISRLLINLSLVCIIYS